MNFGFVCYRRIEIIHYIKRDTVKHVVIQHDDESFDDKNYLEPKNEFEQNNKNTKQETENCFKTTLMTSR